ncbi:flavin monoamine oxidase family protein [Rhodococcus sp. NPDC057014]|uniref:flavin monoamine oxidase family protein n=1 Tax=Rhodococcus sp. NPDC057014 TaxID=3346000 RepID=UPI00363F82C7
MQSKDEQHEDTYDADVVIIGAGFAGATVARECAHRGLRTLILEGNDRVGGRTHTTHLSDGEPFDIGGTYIHWSQPHTWSELSRYGLTGDVIDAVHEPHDWVRAPRGDGDEWCSAEEHYEREKPLVERFFEPSLAVFPRPYDPLFCADAVAEWDQLTVRDRLDQLDLAPDDDALLSALLSTLSTDAPETSSFVGMLRWWAAAGHTYDALFTALLGSKLKHGTVALIDAILADGGAELRLSSPVARIASEKDCVEVTLASGEVVTGAVAVVATPSGVWPDLDFSPSLSAERLDAAKVGMQTPRGSKGAAVIRGEARRFFIQPRLGHKIAIMWTTHQHSDDEQFITFMSSEAMKNPDDLDEVSAALRDLLPNVEVSEVHTDSWGPEDQFARGGWPLLAPGQLSGSAPHETLTKPEGRVVFATADIATLWSSFIDGAIESGLRAARDVREILR